MASPVVPTAGQGRLSPEHHAAALDAMAVRQLDVLVVGGGVLGAGIALDAVTRGLSVGLVERDDWASGASGHSGTLIHGGLRYLGQIDLPRVRAALQERNLLLDVVAPHLVHRVPLLHPLHGHVPERLYVGAGLAAYDALAHSPRRERVVPPHRHLTRRSVRRIAPGLASETLTGAVQFWEAQVDDARLVLTLVRTAAAYGALVAGRAAVRSLTRDDGVVTGAWVHDTEGGRERHVRATVVVVATGPDLSDLAPLDSEAHPRSGADPTIRWQGVHLVVPRQRIRSTSGLVTGRGPDAVLIVPWGRHWLIGTPRRTPAPDDGAAVSEQHIAAVLQAANRHLNRPLQPADVMAAYAGCWPGHAGGGQRVDERPGLVAVAGGDDTGLTTYRRLAERAVDAAVGQLGGLVADCVTTRLPLLGADGYHARWNQRHLLARGAGLHVARVERLLHRYGSLAEHVLTLIRDAPALAEPVSGAEDYLAAEIVYAVTHEGARHLPDLLRRRTRIDRETPDAGHAAAPVVAALVAERLGWDQATTSREITRYLAGTGG